MYHAFYKNSETLLYFVNFDIKGILFSFQYLMRAIMYINVYLFFFQSSKSIKGTPAYFKILGCMHKLRPQILYITWLACYFLEPLVPRPFFLVQFIFEDFGRVRREEKSLLKEPDSWFYMAPDDGRRYIFELELHWNRQH